MTDRGDVGEECVFCGIVAGRVPFTEVFEDATTLASTTLVAQAVAS